MSSRLHNFESRFVQFCELFKYCDKSNSSQVARLQTQFNILQELGKTFPDSSFEHFSADQKLLKDYFDLGKEHYQTFCAPCIGLITADKQSSTKRIMEYFKHPAALHSLIQNRPSNTVAKQKLQDLLGGEKGLDVAEDFVANARMNRFSQIMGYVLSGVAQENLNTYHMKKQLSSKIFKYRNQSVEDFLTSQIVEHDLEFVVQTAESTFGAIPIAGAINATKSSPGLFFEVAPASLSPNSLFINHSQKRVTAVVTNMLEHPTQVLVATHQSLKNLCSQARIDGQVNPLLDYSTEMCFFHTGVLTHPHDGPSVTSYLQALAVAPPLLRQTLMRGSFLSVMGEAGGGKTLRDTLRDTNIHVLGTDSESLYHAMRMAAQVDQHDVKSREMGSVVLNEMTAVLEACVDPSFVSSLSVFQKTLLEQVFGAVANAALHYFSTFPLKNKQKLTLSEKRKLHKIAHILDAEQNNWNTGNASGVLVNFTNILGPSTLDATADAQSQYALAQPLGYSYSPDLQKNIQSHFVVQKDTQDKKQLLSGFILDYLARSQVPECFQEFLNHARVDSVNNPLPSSDKTREFFADVQRMCGGKKSLNALSSQEANLNNPRAAFRRWINQVCVHLFERPTAAGESVVVLSELFNTSLWHDRSLIPFSPKMKSVVGNISQVMLEHSRHPSGAHLSSLLDTVYQTPRRKMH